MLQRRPGLDRLTARRVLFSVPRLLIYAAAAGTCSLALAGFGAVLQRLWRRGAMVELPLIVPFWVLIAGWMLSPYWGALMLQRLGPKGRSEGTILVLGLILMIAIGANSFLATSAFVGGEPHPTADGVTMVFIPGLQWMVLGFAALLQRIVRRFIDWSRP